MGRWTDGWMDLPPPSPPVSPLKHLPLPLQETRLGCSHHTPLSPQNSSKFFLAGLESPKDSKAWTLHLCPQHQTEGRSEWREGQL